MDLPFSKSCIGDTVCETNFFQEKRKSLEEISLVNDDSTKSNLKNTVFTVQVRNDKEINSHLVFIDKQSNTVTAKFKVNPIPNFWASQNKYVAPNSLNKCEFILSKLSKQKTDDAGDKNEFTRKQVK